MRCPECNKRITAKKFLIGICKNCGYKLTMKDYFKKNWKCPMFDICNFADKCSDSDWKNCGTYQCFMGFVKNLKFGYDIKMEPIMEDFSALKPFRLKSGISSEMEMID